MGTPSESLRQVSKKRPWGADVDLSGGEDSGKRGLCFLLAEMQGVLFLS